MGGDSNVDYFDLRGISKSSYKNYEVPQYLINVLGPRDSEILDYGCGYGQLIYALKRLGYGNVSGADVNGKAIGSLQEEGIDVFDLKKEESLFYERAESYDFIVASHVIEHIKKEEIIALLSRLRSLLAPNGKLVVMVPNAQSNTGCYWAYEDFTHTTLFTAGSLQYVLRAAGFSSVTFLDVDCTTGMARGKALFKRALLSLYKARMRFWNVVTSSAYHSPSEAIYSYEIKALAER